MGYVIGFLLCFFACSVGAICGIGGGVIIKPVFDALSLETVQATNFLSGCTVFAMSAYSFASSRLSRGERETTGRPEVFTALGAALGGVAGKLLFTAIVKSSAYPEQIVRTQSICLAIITAGVILFTLMRGRIKTLSLSGAVPCVSVGLALGVVSSFLGIGGGPLNIAVLLYFFSMNTKEAARSSLFIIFCSQGANLILTLATNTVPDFSVVMLVVMIAGALLGGLVGKSIFKRINCKTVNKLLLAPMTLIMVICVYNSLAH